MTTETATAALQTMTDETLVAVFRTNKASLGPGRELSEGEKTWIAATRREVVRRGLL